MKANVQSSFAEAEKENSTWPGGILLVIILALPLAIRFSLMRTLKSQNLTPNIIDFNKHKAKDPSDDDPNDGGGDNNIKFPKAS